jgi:hypothetical protein
MYLHDARDTSWKAEGWGELIFCGMCVLKLVYSYVV